MNNIIFLIGRILLASVFLGAALNKMGDIPGTQKLMVAHGMSWTGFWLAGAIVLEILGSLSLIVGFKARFGALALLVFLVPATYIGHTDFANPDNLIHFTKNLAIMGGLLIVIAFGSGPLSLDARKAPASVDA